MKLQLMLGVVAAAVLNGAWAIRCNREPQNSHTPKSLADNRFQLRVHGNPDKYVPGGEYTVSLRGQRSGRHRATFKKFMIVVEPSYGHMSPVILGHRNVGSLSLVDDTLTKHSTECPNAILQTSSITKSEIYVTWTAPPPGSGCVVFRATVVEDHDVWYMDDGPLSVALCEDMQEVDSGLPEVIEECCACDDALYEMVFEGLWSKPTHPKDFPSNKWETAFSDMIGASHSNDYRFWEYGNFASKGLRRLAEWGESQELENEIMENSDNLRTIIKARRLTYPNVTGRTYSMFRVDTRNHLMSIVSKIEPSPDWIVGVSGVNLCLKNCSWVHTKIINLYPWDGGTDSGISYNSPNIPTSPQQTISRLTASYPNDPSSPFYDATGAEMKPLARLHLVRQQLYEKPCGDVGEPEPEVFREECEVTSWSRWSPCSVSCGEGQAYRQRSYLHRKKARAMGCSEVLMEHETCFGTLSCGPDEEPVCTPSEWGPWNECSVTCGSGIQTRRRRYRTRQEHKHCSALDDAPALQETQSCIGPEGEECEEENGVCLHMEWSSWSPCSVSCGKGKSIRVLLLTEGASQDDAEECAEEETTEEKDCMELASCDMTEELYRELCLSPLKEGACNRNNSRWYFDSDVRSCQNFFYKGCSGNRNNFLTLEECENTCLTDFEEIVEEAEDEDGPVAGLWPASQIFDHRGSFGLPSNLFDIRTEPITAVDGPVVNCTVGRWTRWSACSVTCGNGYKTRSRKIVIHPRNGGLACPKVFKRKKCRKTCDRERK